MNEQLYDSLERLLESPWSWNAFNEAVNKGDVMKVTETLEKTLEASDLILLSLNDIKEIEQDAVKNHINQSNTGSY